MPVNKLVFPFPWKQLLNHIKHQRQALDQSHTALQITKTFTCISLKTLKKSSKLDIMKRGSTIKLSRWIAHSKEHAIAVYWCCITVSCMTDWNPSRVKVKSVTVIILPSDRSIIVSTLPKDNPSISRAGLVQVCPRPFFDKEVTGNTFFFKKKE